MKAVIHVLGSNGYVWDADVAHWLRLECGLVGAMVGGVAAFKQQNAVHGLPLELSEEEVTLALEKGWAELQPALGTADLARQLGADGGGGGRKRGRQPPADDSYHYYDDDDMDADVGAAGEHVQQQAAAAAAAEPTWRAALAEGSALDIPMTPAEAAAANGCASGSKTGSSSATATQGGGGSQGAAEVEVAAAAATAAMRWDFPATEEQQHRYWVFRDLHAKGYRLTGGSKFGADFLVYPGDPTLYHAQFCVRLLPYRQPILPAIMAAATRGSHQARKHLLIASVVMAASAAGAGGAEPAAPAAAVPCADGGGAGEGTAAPEAGAAGSNEDPERGDHQQQQAGSRACQQQQQASPDVQPNGGGSSGYPRLGASSGGTSSSGERYRIHYMTIGPVEGFG